MPIIIPPSGTQILVVPAQNIDVLTDLQSTRRVAPKLELNFAGTPVVFLGVTINSIMSVPSASEYEMIAINMTYNSRYFAGTSSLGQLSNEDQVQAGMIMDQVKANSLRQNAERLKIMQSSQTKIFQITQDVTINKTKTADKAYTAMDGYIRN